MVEKWKHPHHDNAREAKTRAGERRCLRNFSSSGERNNDQYYDNSSPGCITLARLLGLARAGAFPEEGARARQRQRERACGGAAPARGGGGPREKRPCLRRRGLSGPQLPRRPSTSRSPDIDLAPAQSGRVARLLFQEGKCYHCFVVAKIATAACRRAAPLRASSSCSARAPPP